MPPEDFQLGKQLGEMVAEIKALRSDMEHCYSSLNTEIAKMQADIKEIQERATVNRIEITKIGVLMASLGTAAGGAGSYLMNILLK